MDTTDYIHKQVREQAVTCAVYSPTDDDAYSGDLTQTGEVDVHIFSPSSSQLTVTEGSTSDVSLVGLVVPEREPDDSIVRHVSVNDELRVKTNTAKRYAVRGKDPIPDDLDPDLFRLQLDRANASQQPN